MFGTRKKAAADEEEQFALVVKLRDLPFFEGFSPSQLARVADLAEAVEAVPGAVLIDQGRVGTEVFVILEGQASVFVGDDSVATIGPGTMVGEMALIEHRPRSASVVAHSDMQLIAFDLAAFRTLLEEMPTVHAKVLDTLAARHRANAERHD